MISMFSDETAQSGNLLSNKHLPLLFLSTLPLLVVFLYVLYDVHYRTSYNNSRAFIPRDDDNYFYPDDDTFVYDYVGVSLTFLLYIFLIAFVVLGSWATYYAHFMSRRQELLERYTMMGYVVNGNLHSNVRVGMWKLLDYVQCRFVGSYDILTYSHPDPTKAGLVGMAASAHGSTARSNQEGWIVKKLVRRSKAVMDRQRQLNIKQGANTNGNAKTVPIVLLPDCPLSGLIRDDVEYDAAHFSHFAGSKRYKETLLVIAFWMCFTLLSAIYLVIKMHLPNAKRDSMLHGIVVLCVTVLVITPAVACGYHWFRWLHYEKFLTESGKVVQGRVVNEMPLMTDSEDEIEMGQVCGSGYYSQMI